jgi:hypothetical protein
MTSTEYATLRLECTSPVFPVDAGTYTDNLLARLRVGTLDDPRPRCQEWITERTRRKERAQREYTSQSGEAAVMARLLERV